MKCDLFKPYKDFMNNEVTTLFVMFGWVSGITSIFLLISWLLMWKVPSFEYIRYLTLTIVLALLPIISYAIKECINKK